MAASRLLTLLLLLFFTGKNSIAQTYKTYKNEREHFEISIPADWDVIQTNPHLKLIAIRPQDDANGNIPENVNVNFIDAPGGNLDAAYDMSIESNSNLEGFVSITKKGIAENKRYKWYINTHRQPSGTQLMQTIVFVFYAKGKAVLLTCTASNESFDACEPVFFKIASSFKLQ